MIPIKYSDGMPVYTIEQINLYGKPLDVEAYLVTSTLDYEQPNRTDWKFEQERRGSTRPPHLYKRQIRLESTLFQLLGFRGTVEPEMIDHLLRVGYDSRPEYVWDSIRRFIKTNNYSNVFYNRIPTMMHMANVRLRIKKQLKIKIDNITMEQIRQDFKVISYRFDNLKSKPKYFPNIRFIVLKLLQKHNAEFQFKIPLIRTKRKLIPLEDIWDRLGFT